MIYFCFSMFFKRFSLSFISFMKWVFHVSYYRFSSKITTLGVNNYIESEFINNFGIGIAIFICTIFLTILAGKIFK